MFFSIEDMFEGLTCQLGTLDQTHWSTTRSIVDFRFGTLETKFAEKEGASEQSSGDTGPASHVSISRLVSTCVKVKSTIFGQHPEMLGVCTWHDPSRRESGSLVSKGLPASNIEATRITPIVIPARGMRTWNV